MNGQKSNKRPKLLLHVCCGVCGAWMPEMLSRDYEVTIFYFNPNIYPKEEYERRWDAAKDISLKLGVDFVEGEYNHQAWRDEVAGLEDEPEGGKRCLICFSFRLKETARYAKEHGFNLFASTLTIGRNKHADAINPIGRKWADHFGVEFLAGDWKKKGGQIETDKKSREMGIYRQDYCGCEFSMRIP